jgi:hypothetical protein
MRPIHLIVVTLVLAIGGPMPLLSQTPAKKETKTQTAKPKKAQKTLKSTAPAASKAQSTDGKGATSSTLKPPVSGEIQKPPGDNQVQTVPIRPVVLKDQKSPGLALGLSALLPGCGQYYNGDYAKGAIQTGIFAAGLVVALTLGTESSYSSNAYTDYGYYGTYTYYRPETEEWNSAWLYVGIGVAAGAWLWSVIDAPISASDINDESAGLSYGHMIESSNSGCVVGVDVAALQDGPGIHLVIHF